MITLLHTGAPEETELLKPLPPSWVYHVYAYPFDPKLFTIIAFCQLVIFEQLWPVSWKTDPTKLGTDTSLQFFSRPLTAGWTCLSPLFTYTMPEPGPMGLIITIIIIRSCHDLTRKTHRRHSHARQPTRLKASCIMHYPPASSHLFRHLA